MHSHKNSLSAKGHFVYILCNSLNGISTSLLDYELGGGGY